VPDYPKLITRLNHVEPVPRRIRAFRGSRSVVDTTDAHYVWEWSNYPQFYVPRRHVDEGVLVALDQTEETPRGLAHLYAFKGGGDSAVPVARLLTGAARPELEDTFRFEWEALDSWFEEDEEVFVHPRDPYTRVDALRSTRTVRVELGGVVLADSASPVMVFETGLPTRYYLNRTEVAFDHLEASATVTRCPYKGTTTGYWSVNVGGATHADLAWSYDFPTRQLLPIAGLISFYNEKVDIFVDGQPVARPVTHFS
jgi:uncharacterized protein (DUF427 family)